MSGRRRKRISSLPRIHSLPCGIGITERGGTEDLCDPEYRGYGLEIFRASEES